MSPTPGDWLRSDNRCAAVADVGQVANRAGLEALGQQIDSSRRRGRGRGANDRDALGTKRKWSNQRKLVTALITLVVLAVAVVGAGYGYLRYEFDQINSVKCPSCVQVSDGAPYNVLVIGSDTRDGETAAEAKQFGNSATAGGQRSDTIKIVHVDPQTGTASTLSIPRDTFVDLSGVPAFIGRVDQEQDQRRLRHRTQRPGPGRDRGQRLGQDHREHLRHPHQPLDRGRTSSA